jgi:hypothetical protein
MSKFKIAMLLAAFAILNGCKDDKGSEFVGHWVNQQTSSRSYVDISFSDGIYHIDFASPDPIIGDKIEVDKLEGVSVSESVLMIHAPLGNVSMRLEGDTLSMEDQTFKKSK